MTGDRIVDADGHHWPDTRHRCTVCRWPADPVHADLGTHPGCDPATGGDPGGDPDGDHLRDALRLVRAVLGAEPIPVGAS